METMAKRCENLGCQREYREEDKEECVHHSGVPFFHEGYKGWTCCQKKSTDFSTFLNFTPCTRGKHSDQKKEIPIQEVREEEIQEEVHETEEEPPDENQWCALSISETKGLPDCVTSETRLTRCQRCGQSDVSADCVYHKGQVIFHDSLKYWTCCAHKKFTDFDDFHALRGCVSADSHEMVVEVKRPREDWFQTSDQIHLILYGLKGVRALHSTAQTNGRTLSVTLTDSSGAELFVHSWRLKELIRVGSVMIFSSKVEIICGKFARNKFWNNLTEN